MGRRAFLAEGTADARPWNGTESHILGPKGQPGGGEQRGRSVAEEVGRAERAGLLRVLRSLQTPACAFPRTSGWPWGFED